MSTEHLQSMSTAELREYAAKLRATAKTNLYAELALREVEAILGDRGATNPCCGAPAHLGHDAECSEAPTYTAPVVDEAWGNEAYRLGREAGEAAASWAADGNTPLHHIERCLAMLADGDPEVWDFLPRRPDLSGEWADAPTPASIYEAVTGQDYWQGFAFGGDDFHTVVDALAEAWERGVDDTFEAACETALRAQLEA